MSKKAISCVALAFRIISYLIFIAAASLAFVSHPRTLEFVLSPSIGRAGIWAWALTAGVGAILCVIGLSTHIKNLEKAGIVATTITSLVYGGAAVFFPVNNVSVAGIILLAFTFSQANRYVELVAQERGAEEVHLLISGQDPEAVQ